MPTAVTPGEARALLRQIRAVDGHVFLPDDELVVSSERVLAGRIVGHRQVTHAHLLVLAGATAPAWPRSTAP